VGGILVLNISERYQSIWSQVESDSSRVAVCDCASFQTITRSQLTAAALVLTLNNRLCSASGLPACSPCPPGCCPQPEHSVYQPLCACPSPHSLSAHTHPPPQVW
jgi:hypothetical protein